MLEWLSRKLKYLDLRCCCQSCRESKSQPVGTSVGSTFFRPKQEGNATKLFKRNLCWFVKRQQKDTLAHGYSKCGHNDACIIKNCIQIMLLSARSQLLGGHFLNSNPVVTSLPALLLTGVANRQLQRHRCKTSALTKRTDLMNSKIVLER